MEIKVLKDILNVNDQLASKNKHLLESHKIYAVNVMSTPGAGKTSFILETIKRLKEIIPVGVVEGDIASTVDAEAVSQEQVPVVQINTGGECHLDANMISNALNSLPLDNIRLLFIENVGNLVCPAEFTLGESLKLLISSTPEGDDKPLKYPLMFNTADVIIINKIDLIPYLKFNEAFFKRTISAINQRAEFFSVSCSSGEGLDGWVAWLRQKLAC